MTRPERAAQIRQAKRYRAAIKREGLCTACKFRSSETFWGRAICKVGENRQHPQCERDGKGVTFEFDDTTLERFRDAA